MLTQYNTNSTVSVLCARLAFSMCAQSEYSPGILAQAVEAVKAQGVAYFGAVGNDAGTAWETISNWVAVGNRTLHNFGTTQQPDPFMQVQVYGSPDMPVVRFILQVSAAQHVCRLVRLAGAGASVPTAVTPYGKLLVPGCCIQTASLTKLLYAYALLLPCSGTSHSSGTPTVV